MKRFFVFVVVFSMLFVFCSCKAQEKESGSDNDVSETQSTESEDAATTADSVSDTGEIPETEADSVLQDAAVRELAETYFNLNDYSASYGTYRSDNELNFRIDKAVVEDVTLEIGESYNDVCNAGFTVTDDSFPEKEAGGVALGSHFKTSSGKIVDIMFMGERGTAIADGNLYSVSFDDTADEPADVVISGIHVGSPISDVIDAFGNPKTIGEIKYHARNMLALRYRGPNIEISVSIDPSSAAVYDLTLEGYAE